MFFDVLGHVQPLTKAQLFLSIGLGFLVYVGVVSKYDLFFNFQKIVYEFQIWRIVTSVYYMSQFSSQLSILFVAKLIILQFSDSYQKSGFKKGSIDYLYMLVVLHIVLFFFASMFKIYSLNDIFMFVLYYVNGRKDRNQIIIINFLPIRSPYFVWYLMFVNWVMRKLDITENLISIFIGHTFYFFNNLAAKTKFFPFKNLLDTPTCIRIFGGLFDRGPVIPRQLLEEEF